MHLVDMRRKVCSAATARHKKKAHQAQRRQVDEPESEPSLSTAQQESVSK